MPHEILFAVDAGMPSKTQRMRAASSLNGSMLPTTTMDRLERVIRMTNRDRRAVDMRTTSGRTAVAPMLDAMEPDVIKKLNAILNQSIRYVGVAVTGCVGGAANAMQRQGYSATRGGLMTVLNTGDAPILAGQRVHMELDIKDVVNLQSKRQAAIDGIRRTKIVPRLRAVDEQSHLLLDIDDRDVIQDDIYANIGQPWPLMPLLVELARERFPLSV